jgi:hypothetical protein
MGSVQFICQRVFNLFISLFANPSLMFTILFHSLFTPLRIMKVIASHLVNTGGYLFHSLYLLLILEVYLFHFWLTIPLLYDTVLHFTLTMEVISGHSCSYWRLFKLIFTHYSDAGGYFFHFLAVITPSS